MNLPTWKSQKHTLYKRHRYSPTLGCPLLARNTTTPSAQASQSAESKKRSTLSPRGFDGADKRPLVTKSLKLSHELANQNYSETYTYSRHITTATCSPHSVAEIAACATRRRVSTTSLRVEPRRLFLSFKEERPRPPTFRYILYRLELRTWY